MSKLPARPAILTVACILVACGGGGGGKTPPPPPPPADSTPPDTTLSGTPPALATVTTATFSFTATEAGSTFETRIDGAVFAAATSPQNLSALAQGSHTFDVRAKDAAGNVDATPATFTWTVDSVAPDTTLTGAPAVNTSTTSANFDFTSSETNSTFEARLDGGAFAVVTSPRALTGLADGSHTFEVRAKDAAGNVDASPGSATWVVDTIPPHATLTAGPPAVTNSTSATFSATADDPNAIFCTDLDNSGGGCAAGFPFTVSGLAAGTHTFTLRTRDAAFNFDPNPPSVTWIVDTTAPTGTIVFPTPVSATDAASVTVRGTASDAHGVAAVRVNGVLATTSTSFNTWRASVPLVAGNNTLTVSITDVAGNTTASAATASVANRGPMLLQSVGADYDPTRDRIVMTDTESRKLVTYSASTGIGQLLADFSLVSSNSALADVVVDAANDRALVLDWGQDALIAVSLANGDNRSVLSQGAGSGSGPTAFPSSFGLAHDPANNRAFVTGGSAHAVIAVNLATGARSIVSSASVGTGTAFSNPTGIVYDAGAARLLVADAPLAGAAIYSVDIATGNRVLVSQSPGTGSGPAIPGPLSMKLDAANNRLYVLDGVNTNSVYCIDLATGNRTQIAGTGIGSGPTLSNYWGLAYRPSTHKLFVGQHGGDVVSIDTGTLVRATVVDARVGTGTRLDHPQTVLAEQTSGAVTSLLFGEPEAQRIMRVDLATSARTTVSGSGTGSGPALGRLVDFVLDTRAPANGQSIFGLLGAPGNALVSIDIATGNRTALKALGATTQPRNLRLDAGANRVLYTNTDFGLTTNGLYAIQLPGLGESAVSSAGVGGGAAFTGPSSFVLEPANNPTRALFIDMNPWTWRTIDLASGVRGSFTTTSGNPALPLLGALYLDGANSQVYGLNLYPPHLFVSTVMPGGGETDRGMISGQVPGSMGIVGTGPLVAFGSGVVADTARGVAFVSDSTSGAIFAIDIASGDRVVIAR